MPVLAFNTMTIGFSLFACFGFLLSYVFFIRDIKKTKASIFACGSLMLALISLQVGHLHFFWFETALFDLFAYRLLLYLTPVSYYFFCRSILFSESTFSNKDLVHFIPIIIGPWLPIESAIPMAFAIGVGYCFWMLGVLMKIREGRAQFVTELFFFGLFSLVSVVVMALAIFFTYIDQSYFFLFYANSIALCCLLVMIALITNPELVEQLREIVEVSYAQSTLNHVDIEQKTQQLEKLMINDKLYQDENLNLDSLAQSLGLSSHQLSELINTRFGKNVSRFIRDIRVEQAKKLLIEQAQASVLSIGMEIGFRSQSSFYAAFKEVTGMSPGKYRKPSV